MITCYTWNIVHFEHDCLNTVHIKANLLKKQTKSLKTNDKYSNRKHDALKTKQNRTKKTEQNKT